MNRLSTDHLLGSINEVLKHVSSGDPVIISQNGEDKAALISLDDLVLLERNLDKENQQDLEEYRQAREEAIREGTVSWDDLKKELGL